MRRSTAAAPGVSSIGDETPNVSAVAGPDRVSVMARLSQGLVPRSVPRTLTPGSQLPAIGDAMRGSATPQASCTTCPPVGGTCRGTRRARTNPTACVELVRVGRSSSSGGRPRPPETTAFGNNCPIDADKWNWCTASLSWPCADARSWDGSASAPPGRSSPRGAVGQRCRLVSLRVDRCRRQLAHASVELGDLDQQFFPFRAQGAEF